MYFDDARLNGMRSRRSIFLIAVTSFALTFTTLGIAPAAASTSEPDWLAEVIEESATRDQLTKEVKDGELRLLVVRNENGEPDVDVLNISSKISLDYALRATDNDPAVVSLQIDEKISLIDQPEIAATAFATPTSAYAQWGYSALRLGEIHTSLTGVGIRVAVIDSGVDRTGPELNGDGLNGTSKVLDGCDWVTSPNNTCVGTGVLDENGHGTHVAGIIAAKNDGLGVTGVAPSVEILPLRVLDANGEGWLADIAAAIDYAVNNGANVINLSLGGTADRTTIRLAVERAISLGVVVVAAAGNDGASASASYPAAYPGVIAVAATNESNRIASYSSGGNYIDSAAPGSDILSAWPFGSGYARASGTSMASPHVAGIVALLLDQNVAANEVAAKITSTAITTEPFTDYVSTRYGSGFVNPYLALGCNSSSCVPPTSPPTQELSIDTISVDPGLVMEPSPASSEAPAAPIVATPTVKETLKVKALKNRRLSIKVSAPKGSKTFIQRKIGNRWKTQIKVTTKSSRIFSLKTSGTYRVVIISPNERATSKNLRVRR
jgi:subtilisin family serine protease